MEIQIPSYIKNAPAGSNNINPSVHSSPHQQNHNPKRNKVRILLFVLTLVVLSGLVGYYFFFVMNDDYDDNTNLVVATTNVNQHVNQVILNSNVTNINSLINLNTNILLNANSLQNNNVTNQNIDPFPTEAEQDPDGDFLLTTIEDMYGTDPNISDTDNDGFDDFTEINGCYNPLGKGRMGIESYNKYINDYNSLLLEAGMITKDMVDYLNDLWVDVIAQEILIKEKDINFSAWEDIEIEELERRCLEFENLFNVVEDEEEMITLCQASTIFSTSFCNVSKPI